MKRILVLDDDPTLLHLLGQTLDQSQYKVMKNNHPMEAMEQIMANPQGIDLIITDFEMPGMKGDEFVAQLQKYRAAHIPVLLLTAHLMDVKDKDFYDALIIKPFDPEGLKQKVKELIEAA